MRADDRRIINRATTWSRRAKLLAFGAITMVTGSCQDAHRGLVAPVPANARLSVSASALLLADATIVIHVGYTRTGGATIELARQSLNVSPGGGTAGATQSVALTVDVAPCLADVDRPASSSGTCPAFVDIELTRGGVVLDRQLRNILLQPGQNLSLPDPISLLEVSRVAVQLAGTLDASVSPPRAEVNQRLTATATAVDRSNVLVPDRIFTWSTSDATILRLSATTGATVSIDMLRPGVAEVRAATGDRVEVRRIEGVSETVRQLTLRPADTTVFIGDTVQYTAEPRGVSNAIVPNVVFQYAASSSVATISAQGAAIARAVGSTTITASTSLGVGGSTVSAAATLRVSSRPVLTVVPTAVNMTTDVATPLPSQAVSVSGANSAVLAGLSAQVIGAAPVAVTFDRTTTPATMTITVTSQVQVGSTANGTVRVRSSTPGVLPVDIPVSVTGLVPSALVATPATVDFGILDPGTQSAFTQVAITALAGRSLSGLSAQVAYLTGTASAWLTDVALDRTTAPATLRFRANTANLAAGTYTASITVAGANPINSAPAVIQLRLQVSAPATLQLAQTTIDLGTVDSGTVAAAAAIAVSAAGGRVINGLTADTVYAPGTTTGWLLASLDAPTTPATLQIQQRTASLRPGVYTATVVVGAPAARVAPVRVTVRLTVRSVVELLATPSSLSVVTDSGGTARIETVAIATKDGRTASGLSVTRTFSGNPPVQWLTANLAGTSTSTTLQLIASPSGLRSGNYVATVTVAASSPANTLPTSITVNMRVLGADSLVISPTFIDFGTVPVGTTGLSQTYTVSSLFGRAVVISAPEVQNFIPQNFDTWLTTMIAPGRTLLTPTAGVVQVSTVGLDPGQYSAEVLLPSISVALRGSTMRVSVAVSASLFASKQSVTFGPFSRAVVAVNDSTRITATNQANVPVAPPTISYAPGQPTGWLVATMVEPITAAALSLEASTGNLPNGTYSAIVTVTGGPFVTPVSISVQLIVQ